jgi:hypothetical protein
MQFSGRAAYFKSGWNVFDFVIVLTSILGIAFAWFAWAAGIRLLRVLRPLRLLVKIREIRASWKGYRFGGKGQG